MKNPFNMLRRPLQLILLIKATNISNKRPILCRNMKRLWRIVNQAHINTHTHMTYTQQVDHALLQQQSRYHANANFVIVNWN